MLRALVPLLLTAALGLAQERYDLLLKGGHVIDPKNNLSAVRDVAIARGKIVAVGENLPVASARRVADVSSLYVVPGLVDIHVHAFAADMGREYVGEWCIRPDHFSFRSGVTTMVDAGSAGWRNFERFRSEVFYRSRTRLLAWINIVGRGMGGRNDVEQDVKDMQPALTAEMAKRHKDVVVGIKIAHFAGPEWVAVERTLEAGELAGLPIMVDFATFRPERPFQDLVTKKLRAGDIYTHAYLGAVPMLDEQQRVLPYLFEAKKRGVIFDVGHGGGSFSFRQAVPAVQQGFLPDSISTDLHTDSMNAGMKDMTNVMSKFLNLGLPLDDVIRRSTWNPAREIHREELGHLSVGAGADVTVLRVEKGNFGFLDASRRKMRGSQKLVAELTIRDGQVVWDLNGVAADDWDKPRR